MRTYSEVLVPLIIPDGYAQAVWVMALTGDSEPMVTTCGLDITGVLSSYPALCNHLLNNFGNTIMAQVYSQYTVERVDLYVGQASGPNVVYASTDPAIPGEQSLTSLPQNCAVLIRKPTGTPGRRGRGRFYIPGIPEASVSQIGDINSGPLDGWQDSADAFYSELATPSVFDPAPPVILHHSEGIGTEPAPTPITSFQVETRIATQRRRLRP